MMILYTFLPIIQQHFTHITIDFFTMCTIIFTCKYPLMTATHIKIIIVCIDEWASKLFNGVFFSSLQNVLASPIFTYFANIFSNRYIQIRWHDMTWLCKNSIFDNQYKHILSYFKAIAAHKCFHFNPGRYCLSLHHWVERSRTCYNYRWHDVIALFSTF